MFLTTTPKILSESPKILSESPRHVTNWLNHSSRSPVQPGLQQQGPPIQQGLQQQGPPIQQGLQQQGPPSQQGLQQQGPPIQQGDPIQLSKTKRNRKSSSTSKRKRSPLKYDSTPFDAKKIGIVGALKFQIKNCPIFNRIDPKNDPSFDDFISNIVFDTLPRGIDSNLGFLNDLDVTQLAAYVCMKFYALSITYPMQGVETNPLTVDILNSILSSRTTELTQYMVKNCVTTPTAPFHCSIDSIPSSRPLTLASEFISATCVADPNNPDDIPFNCYSIGNYLYSIGPMIIDPANDHIGRNLIMIRVLNYKNHIYPHGIYFWVYPSSSEGGLNRIFFKLPGGITGATYIKGTDYFSLSEEALLEAPISNFSIFAQSKPPTVIDSYETFVCFLGNMTHLQKQNISDYLPTANVVNRHCYQINMDALSGLFSPNDPNVTSEQMSKMFFRHIFDNGFNNKYTYNVRGNVYSFAPTSPINFQTICEPLKNLDPQPTTLDWIPKLLAQNLQPVCSFSCFYSDQSVNHFESLIRSWSNTQTVQGIYIHKYPHPNVCTLTGWMADILGNRGNSFLPYMAPASIVKLLPNLPIEILQTYSRYEPEVKLQGDSTRNQKQYNPETHVLNPEVLQGDQGTVLTRRLKHIIKKIAAFFNLQPTNLNLKIHEHLKVCLFTFLGIDPAIENDRTFKPTEKYFNDWVEADRSKTGVKNLMSIQTTTTYVRMIAADIFKNYFDIDPIPDAFALNAPTSISTSDLKVQISWLGENDNYVPFGTFDYEANDTGLAKISSLFTQSDFNPFIIKAIRKSKTFIEKDLDAMVRTRNLASNTRNMNTGRTPADVYNKTMLLRVIIYPNKGLEKLKFGAIEVIVAVSSTAVFNKKVKYLHFGIDVQFSVVSMTACHCSRDSHGNHQFRKVQTFHGTNADGIVFGIYGTNKSADYAATLVGHDQYHPTVSEFSRVLSTIDDNYNTVAISPYNTPEHWIMKLFAPVLKADVDGQSIRDKIFEKWNWQHTIRSLYQSITDTDVKNLMTQIKNMGNILRIAAQIFFSEPDFSLDQVDEDVFSVSSHTSNSSPGSSPGSSPDSSSSRSSSSSSSSSRSSSSRTNNAKRRRSLKRFLLKAPLATETYRMPKRYKPKPKVERNSSDSETESDHTRNWSSTDTEAESLPGYDTAGGTRRLCTRKKKYNKISIRTHKRARNQLKQQPNKNNKVNKNKNIKTIKVKVKKYRPRLQLQ